jgi:hypothetical protein
MNPKLKAIIATILLLMVSAFFFTLCFFFPVVGISVSGGIMIYAIYNLFYQKFK